MKKEDYIDEATRRAIAEMKAVSAAQARRSDAGAVALDTMRQLQGLGMTVRAMRAEGDELVFTVAVKVEGA